MGGRVRCKASLLQGPWIEAREFAHLTWSNWPAQTTEYTPVTLFIDTACPVTGQVAFA